MISQYHIRNLTSTRSLSKLCRNVILSGQFLKIYFTAEFSKIWCYRFWVTSWWVFYVFKNGLLLQKKSNENDSQNWYFELQMHFQKFGSDWEKILFYYIQYFDDFWPKTMIFEDFLNAKFSFDINSNCSTKMIWLTIWSHQQLFTSNKLALTHFLKSFGQDIAFLLIFGPFFGKTFTLLNLGAIFSLAWIPS